MVGTGHDSIQPVEFASRIHPNLPVEVIERENLMRRLPAEHLTRPQRPSFRSLLLVRSGQGAHTVDFVEIPLRPGRLVQVLPGQVQSWDTESDADATLVLSQYTMSSSLTGAATTAYRDLDAASIDSFEALLGILRQEQARFDDAENSRRLMSALFEALCCIFDREPGQRAANLPDAYVAFVAAIENDLRFDHTVKQRARNLGYSERTLTRACRRVTGRGAREVLNERLLLEAKRLLAHTDQPASSIAAELGFSEATNFHKFFARLAAQRPIEFRNSYRRAD